MADQVYDILTVNNLSKLMGNVGINTLNPKQRVQIGDKFAFHDGGWKGLAFNGYWNDNGPWKALEDGFIGLIMWDTDNGAFRIQTGPHSSKDTSPTIEDRLTILNNGDINVTGDIILTGADCAEEFDIIDAESAQPGTVMVIDDNGALRPSVKAYDKRVAGIISGAGNLQPGITLGRKSECSNRLPIALTGKAYCKVDAEYMSIEVGDLLTTSYTTGHAMKATDAMKSFGAVIGKAIQPLKTGRGIIPILVALQ
jgi:hypothetical protein